MNGQGRPDVGLRDAAGVSWKAREPSLYGRVNFSLMTTGEVKLLGFGPTVWKRIGGERRGEDQRWVAGRAGEEARQAPANIGTEDMAWVRQGCRRDERAIATLELAR